jgi:hydroxymethylpyrimidine kinase/phosphomethylpyrimidine kinase/thiamine-phosphate diphosphorylase
MSSLSEIPPLVTTDDGELYVRLETQYAQSILTPSQRIDHSQPDLTKRYTYRYEQRRLEGYPVEDAVVLSLMDCCLDGEPTAEALADVTLMPRLVDTPSRSETFLNRSNRSSFPSLIAPRPGPYPIVADTDMLHRLLDAGAGIIQLRIKTDPASPETDAAVSEAVQIATRYPESQLFINDHWQAAIRHGAYGVHLGQEDLRDADLQAIHTAGLRLGLSSHAYWEVARALTVQPSYIACGPIFPTQAKAMPWVPQGIRNLTYWSRLIPFTVIGIGGVTLENLPEVWETGCDSVAMIAAVTSAENPATALQAFNQAWDRLESGYGGNSRSLSFDIAAPTLE